MEITAESVQSSIDELASCLPEFAGVISGKLSSKSVRLRPLMSKANTKVLDLKKGVVTYKGSEPYLIRGVKFFSPDPDQVAKLINVRGIKVDGTTGVRKRGFRPKGADYSYVSVDSFCSGFELELNAAKPIISLTKIEAIGYSLAQLDEFSENLQKGISIRLGLDEFIVTYKEEFNSVKEQLEVAKEELDEVKEETKATNSHLESLANELKSLELAKVLITSEMEKLAEANRAAANAKEQVEGELKALNATMGTTRHELKELISEKRLISDEYSDFVKEGRGQATTYGWLSLAPILGALVVLGFLLNSGWNFAEIAVSTPTEAYAHLLQRAPYTLATVVTFSLLVQIAHMLIKKVIQIHGDRLTLAKLLVVARDTVVASSADLEMDDEDIFNERVRLKMRLLKQYLKMEDEDVVELDKGDSLKEIIEKGRGVVNTILPSKKDSST